MPSSTTLSHLPRLSLYPLVIITHNIYTSEWDERTEEVLLTWYIRDYWSTLEFREGIPQFLIFLNIEYTREKPVSWIQKLFRRRRLTKQRIVKQLLEIFTFAGEFCPCLVLPELTSISREDVREWFHMHNIYDNMVLREEKINTIFRENDRTVEYRSMAYVENELMVKESNLCLLKSELAKAEKRSSFYHSPPQSEKSANVAENLGKV